MNVSFEGIGEQVVSFKASGSLKAGQLCAVKANATVSPCADGDKFAGVCIASDGGFAEVKCAGYVELGYSGAAPAFGYTKLAAAGDRYVKASADGRECLVVKIDEPRSVVGLFI